MIENPPSGPPAEPPSDHEFSNLEVVDEVMTGDDPVRLEALKAFYLAQGISEKQLDASVQARRLRRQVHAAMTDDVEQRIAERPEPTAEERSMGVYEEMVEPQIRDAVRVMRRKGYDTRSSGFSDFNYQSVNFTAPLPELPVDVRSSLEALGVEARKNSLSFACEEIDLGKMKETWDAVADALPDLGHPVGETGRKFSPTYYRRKSQPRHP